MATYGINLDQLTGASPQLLAMLKEKIAEAERLQRERDECPVPTTPPTTSELAAREKPMRVIAGTIVSDQDSLLSDKDSKAMLVNAAAVMSDRASTVSDVTSEIAPTESDAATWLNDFGDMNLDNAMEGIVTKGDKFFTKDGKEVSGKWVKRMRQKMAKQSGASSSSCAAANTTMPSSSAAKKPRNNEPVKPGNYQARAEASASASTRQRRCCWT